MSRSSYDSADAAEAEVEEQVRRFPEQFPVSMGGLLPDAPRVPTMSDMDAVFGKDDPKPVVRELNGTRFLDHARPGDPEVCPDDN